MGSLPLYSAPRIYTLHIPTDKIRDVIDPAAKSSAGSSSRPASRSTWKTMARSTWRRPTKLRPTKRSRLFPTSRPRPRWARPTWAKSCAWWISARSSRSFRDGRAAAHQRNRGEPHPRRSRRAEGRRPDPGEGAGARRQQNQAEPQSGCSRNSAKSSNSSSTVYGRRSL